MTSDRSLDEVNESVPVPREPGIWRRFLSFSGPAYLVAVGYMDPGNWATDIAAGSRYGHALLWVLLLSNAMAILLQSLSTRLGLVAGRDLAQACRDRYPKAVTSVLWILCELAIVACDLAEVTGAAIGLELLFGIPLLYGTVITALDTFLLLFLHRAGIRKMEAFILVLVGTIGACMLGEIIFSRPDLGGILAGFAPSLPDSQALYFAIGILGATVMPHNLYLHSALVQSRRTGKTAQGIHQSLRYNMLDSILALNLAFLINAAILIMAAAVFFRSGHTEVAGIEEAHHLLEPLLGIGVAPVIFAVALIAAGQSSTITGTLAGQIVMEGFVELRLKPWVRRLLTRSLAIVPAVAAILWLGESAVSKLLVLSQVCLSLQLSFAVVPLIKIVSDRELMGAFALRGILRVVAWAVALVVAVLNAKLVLDEVEGWLGQGGLVAALTWSLVLPVAALALCLLGIMIIEPGWLRRRIGPSGGVHGHPEAQSIAPAHPFRRIAAALDFSITDAEVIARASALAVQSRCPLLLIHVVESAGARALGQDAHDSESRADQERLERYAAALGKHDVEASVELGFGDPVGVLAEIVARCEVDLLVLGAHGHRGVSDWLNGETIDHLRHRLPIDVLVVGKPE